MRIKFAGQTLPKHVFLFKMRHQVLPYIPATKICYNCFRIGHVSVACKSRPRCINCGGDRHEEKVQCPKAQDSPRCLNCGGDHLTTSQVCEAIILHRKVSALAVTENITFTEAKLRIKNLHGINKPQGDPRYDFAGFPSLPNRYVSSSSSGSNSSNTLAGISSLSSLEEFYPSFSSSPKSFNSPNEIHNKSLLYAQITASPKSCLKSASENHKEEKKLRKVHFLEKITHPRTDHYKNSISHGNYSDAHKNILFFPNGRQNNVAIEGDKGWNTGLPSSSTDLYEQENRGMKGIRGIENRSTQKDMGDSSYQQHADPTAIFENLQNFLFESLTQFFRAFKISNNNLPQNLIKNRHGQFSPSQNNVNRFLDD